MDFRKCIIGCIFVIWHSAFAQPTTIKNITSLAFHPKDPSILYVGTSEDGLYKTTDGGKHFKPVAFPNDEIKYILLDVDVPTKIFVINYSYEFHEDYAYKSDDNGESWNKIHGLNKEPVTTIVQDPINTSNLYAGKWRENIFKSTDGGFSWFSIADKEANVSSIVIDPTNSNSIYATSWSYFIIKSTNAGETWHRIFENCTDTFVTQLSINPTQPNKIYAGFSAPRGEITKPNCFSGIIKSEDSGENWLKTAGLDNVTISKILVDPNRPYLMYAATIESNCDDDGRCDPGRGIFKSIDSGNHWTKTSLPNVSVTDLVLHPKKSNLLFAATKDNGLFASNDFGDNWHPVKIHR